MGREIRRVPPNWEHPRKGDDFQPMRNRDAETVMAKWQEEFAKWVAGGYDHEYPKSEPYRSFCNWYGGPPDPEYYRPKWDEASATWWQVYETVSEGTPVSPAFATPEELVDYLVANGDFWDQARRKSGRSSMNCQPWDRKVAETFVKQGWATSFVVDNHGNIRSGVETLADL